MNNRTATRLAAFVLLPLLVPLPAAHAATAGTSFNVTANVAATCSVTATSLAFGAYANVQLDAENTMSVTCTSGTAYSITLNDGLNVSGTQRRMSDGASHYLNYDLYTTSGRTTLWQGITSVNDTGNGSAQSHPVYGRLPAPQTLYVGNYSDTITVTVTY